MKFNTLIDGTHFTHEQALANLDYKERVAVRHGMPPIGSVKKNGHGLE